MLLGIILLPLLVKFSLIYKTWAFQIVHVVGSWGEQTGLPFWAGAKGSSVLLGLPFPWAWRVGLRAYFLNPISCPPALGYRERVQGLYRFLNRVRLPRVCSGLVWLGLVIVICLVIMMTFRFSRPLLLVFSVSSENIL